MSSHRKAKLEADKESAALSIDERAELKNLRKKVKSLLMEQDFLKKASAFFAKETSKIPLCVSVLTGLPRGHTVSCHASWCIGLL